jgi:hypothetical protein
VELPTDAPTVLLIEPDGCYIRLENAKAQSLMTASDYLSFTLRKQILADPTSPVLSKHP